MSCMPAAAIGVGGVRRGAHADTAIFDPDLQVVQRLQAGLLRNMFDSGRG